MNAAEHRAVLAAGRSVTQASALASNAHSERLAGASQLCFDPTQTQSEIRELPFRYTDPTGEKSMEGN